MSEPSRRSPIRLLIPLAIAGLVAGFLGGSGAFAGAEQDWSLNATIIEACSCPMFCQCYFNATPSAHGHDESASAEHFCRFNNAFQVNRGSHGDVTLDGARFWVAGDLGAEFDDNKMDWAVLTFDPSVTKPQRDAIAEILGHVYPVEWESFSVAPDARMEWLATDDRAVAKLDGGKTAEVVLNRFPGNTNDPVVIQNLKYWGVPRNDGFVLMPNEVQAYRAGDKAYEFKGTNGFMITIDINSKDVAGDASSAGG
ncbi:MAG TPA: DUF1326 domain-containing protein [Thermoanaerobaculia bacterium]|nr:DUF1326 domain-containing protein [Thermoanaerobaculia bacterium]